MKKIKGGTMRTMVLALVLGISAAMTLAIGVPAAGAAFGVAGFDGEVLQQDGTAATQAGAHPYMAGTTIDFNQIDLDPVFGFPRPDGLVRRTLVELPPGLVGNPAAVPMCTSQQFTAGGSDPGCPAASQVGTADVFTSALTLTDRGVFNMVPPDGVAAAFAFVIAGVRVNLYATVRTTGDYGVTIDVRDTPQALPIFSTTVRLWGVPGDHGTGAVDVPFLTNPTACASAGTGLLTKLSATSWEGATDSASFISHDVAPNEDRPLGPTGCDAVPFDPSFTATPSSSAPDGPTGLDVGLSFPTDGILNPDGIATAALKDATVTLPEGMTINPAAAGGLTACSDAELKLTVAAPVTCPEASKVGTATATTPLLSESLSGGIYVRSQNSDDPASGEMFRIALVLENKERGLSMRLPGQIRVDPGTGRIVTEFDNNPQLPVGDIHLAFKTGSRAPLATPPTCGEKTVEAELTSWSGKTVNRRSTFTIDCTSGLGGFAPSFTAGTATPMAAAFSPFALSIAKPDGDTPLTGIRLELPTGLLAQVDGNLGTQVGTVMAYAGPGSNPFGLPGKVYLEGSYGDAPYSLRVVVPAKAGPFDLGTVTVRQKIYVDPNDAHVTVVSDPLPTIVAGVPVRLQRLDVNVDKPGFIINPTSCAAKTITATLSSASGQTVPITNRFQVGECAAIGYAPKLAMGLSGKGQTKDGTHPTLTARLATNAGDANSRKVTVTLPLSLALDVDNANGLCEPTDAAANRCPAASVVGHAKAQSILPDPLQAPVYFVRGERKDAKTGRIIKTLPKLFIPLTADGVTVNLNASSDVVGDRLVTTFDTLPDAPFSSFDLTIDGGKHGILAVSSHNVCAASQVANGQFVGQNGKTFSPAITMTTQCTFGIQASRHTSTALKLTVSGLGAGKVSVSGKGFAKTSRTISSATVATLSAPLTAATRQALAHHRNVKVKVSVAFTPKGAKKAKRVTKTLTIHAAKARR